MIKYSVTIWGDGWKEKSDRCYSIQDVIEYIVENIGWCDNNDCFFASQMTVYIAGTDDLVAYKEPEDALEDFIVELCQASFMLEETHGKSVLEWLAELEKHRKPSKRAIYTYEEY